MAGSLHRGGRASLLLVLPLLLLACAWAPAAAQAAERISLDSGGRLTVRGSELPNRVVLRYVDGRLRIIEANEDEQLVATPGSGCTIQADATSSTALCPPRRSVVVSSRGGDDAVSVGNGLTRRSERTDCDASAQGPAVRADLGRGGDLAEVSAARDRLHGGSGADQLLGCRGDDRLDGGPGRDRLSGDRGADVVRGRGGRDQLIGCTFNPDDSNYPIGNPGDDRLFGGGGSDYLRGCAGADRLDAGTGDDAVNAAFDPGSESDRVDCGAGDDLLAAGRRDRASGCERETSCFTDQFPIECSQRLAAGRARSARRFP